MAERTWPRSQNYDWSQIPSGDLPVAGCRVMLLCGSVFHIVKVILKLTKLPTLTSSDFLLLYLIGCTCFYFGHNLHRSIQSNVHRQPEKQAVCWLSDKSQWKNISLTFPRLVLFVCILIWTCNHPVSWCKPLPPSKILLYLVACSLVDFILLQSCYLTCCYVNDMKCVSVVTCRWDVLELESLGFCPRPLKFCRLGGIFDGLVFWRHTSSA